MKNIQNFIFNILSLLFLLCAILLVVQNLNETATIQFATFSIDYLRVGVILAITTLLGALSVLMRHWANKIGYILDSKKTERELERASVEAESAEEKVKVLEAKVQTLETALDQALNQTDTQSQPPSEQASE